MGRKYLRANEEKNGKGPGGVQAQTLTEPPPKTFLIRFFWLTSHTYIGWRRKSHDQSSARVGSNLTIASANIIGCRSCESTHLPPPIWPGFKSRCRRLFPFGKRSLPFLAVDMMPPLVTNQFSHDRYNIRQIIRLWMVLERTTLKPKLNLREKLWPRARITC